MAPISCSRISLASSVTDVSGPTHSTPLCIASLTFMVDLRCSMMLPPFVDEFCHSQRRERLDRGPIVLTASATRDGAGRQLDRTIGGKSLSVTCPSRNGNQRCAYNGRL